MYFCCCFLPLSIYTIPFLSKKVKKRDLHHFSRYVTCVTTLSSTPIKRARASAEGVIISIIGLERCGFKQNPVRVRFKVCIWDSNPNRLGYAYGIGLELGLGLVGIGLCLG